MWKTPVVTVAMSQTQHAATTRSQTAVDAVETPHAGAGTRSVRGLVAVVATSVVATAVALMPALLAVGAVSTVAATTVVTAIRTVPNQSRDPPDQRDRGSVRQTGAAQPAD